jgi:hypothetical protein
MPPEADEGTENAGVSPEVLESRKIYTQFWGEFLQRLKLDDQSQPIQAPGKQTNQYFYMPTGSKGWVSAYLAQSQGNAGVYLTFEKGPVGDRIYEALEADRENIDAALGCPVVWDSDGSKHWVLCKKSYPGVLLTTHRGEVQAWLADVTNRFVNVFRPRIAALMQDQ